MRLLLVLVDPWVGLEIELFCPTRLSLPLIVCELWINAHTWVFDKVLRLHYLEWSISNSKVLVGSITCHPAAVVLECPICSGMDASA